MKKLVCTLLVCVMAMVAVAQEREENRLGWNIALQGGAHYSAFENTRHASFGDAVNGHVGLSVGYDFSHAIGARAELSYGRNISGTNTVESERPLVLYHCNDVSLFADAIFNLSHLLSKDRRNNFMIEAKGYVGLDKCGNFFNSIVISKGIIVDLHCKRTAVYNLCKIVL